MIYNKTIISNNNNINELFKPVRGVVKVTYFAATMLLLISILTFVFILNQYKNVSGLMYLTFVPPVYFLGLAIFLSVKVFPSFKGASTELIFEYEFEEELFRCKSIFNGKEFTETFYYKYVSNIVYFDNIYYIHINTTRKYTVDVNGFINDDLEDFKRLIKNVRR